jgi:hypothetical protein
MCDICQNKSPDSRDVGVAAVPAAPVSIMWCQNCLQNNAVPLFVVETWLFAEFEQHEIEMPSDPPTDMIADWVLEMTVWRDDKYVKIKDDLPRIWNEEREKLATS